MTLSRGRLIICSIVLTDRWSIRLVIQSFMATAFALRDGLRDARQNRAPYGWSLFMDPEHRLRDGWRSIRTVFFVALAVDVVYQLVQLERIYLGEALIIAQIVALLPYVLRSRSD
jgi:hypothetical protein